MPMTVLCIFIDIKGDKSSMLNKLQSLFTTRKGLLRLLLIIGIIGIGASIPTLYKYEWSGFGKDSNKSESTEETLKDGKVISTKRTATKHFQSPKTLWDWLCLGGTIAILVMIYLFQAGEQRRADKQANVGKEAELGTANLCYAILRDANLSNALLRHADLRYAHLNGTNLTGTNLTAANLDGTSFIGANLSGAFLNGANLKGTHFGDALLHGANFTEVKNLTIQQIKAAKNCETAKYDPKFRKLLGLPSETPLNSGADTQN
ncbi:hypothetical protein CAL7716_100200 (plasmid) [Calothrix sp. PCC 7716]|nr:hypothetical protein CAL7716_100200 [Calothrix sp. PCC 7716]